MKGYFSRLIERTGIVFGSRRGASKLSQQRLTVPKSRDETRPIHVDEEKYVGSQTEHPGEIDQKKDDVVEKISSPPRDVEEERDLQVVSEKSDKPLEDRSGEKVEIESSITKENRAKHPEREVPKEPPVEKSRRVELAPEQPKPPGQDITEEKKAPDHRREPISSDGDERQLDQSSAIPSIEGSPSEVEFRPKPTKSKVQIWQKAYKEVREWVAVTPAADEKDATQYVESRKAAAEPEPPTPIREETKKSSVYPEPKATQRTTEPEIHDFHLSIGTISVTVEEPQQEIQRIEPPRIVEKQPVEKSSTSSRLRRHYLRI